MKKKKKNSEINISISDWHLLNAYILSNMTGDVFNKFFSDVQSSSEKHSLKTCFFYYEIGKINIEKLFKKGLSYSRLINSSILITFKIDKKIVKKLR